MKLPTLQAAFGSALVLLSIPACDASAAHRKVHALAEKHTHLHVHRTEDLNPVAKRGGSCALPTDDPNVVAVTPHAVNAGWALSPDRPCAFDSYCPYACKPGMVMAQWDPHSSYTYPSSMNGGLYCDKSGNVKKPFPNKALCVQGTGAVTAVNKCGKLLSFCQTVLPGLEDMIIPTLVGDSAVLAVPDTSYWASTAAHYYINPPGTGVEGCIWGDEKSPVGNWAYYVAGANTDGNGITFVKLGFNPIWEDSPLKNTLPTFGVRIECPDGDCNGLPCEINPNPSGKVNSNLASVGAGGASFCVVTVPKGGTANIVTFNVGSGSSSSGSDSSGSGSSSSGPSRTADSGQHAAQAPKSTSVKPSSTKASDTPTSSDSSPTAGASTTQASTTGSGDASDSTSDSTSDSSTTYDSYGAHPTVKPGVFHENGTSSPQEASPTSGSSQSQGTSAPSGDKKAEAGRQQGSAAFAGLIVAFVAATCFF